MSLVNLESDHRSFIDALLSAPRARGARSPEALFDRACDQALERAELSRRALEDDMRDGSIAGVAETQTEQRDVRHFESREGASNASDGSASPGTASATGSTAAENNSNSQKPATDATPVAETSTVVPKSATAPVSAAPAESAASASAQVGSSAMSAIDTPDLAIFEDATIELPSPEARTLGDLAGRLPALEILARRHGEAVARLLAGAMQVESGLPGEENLDPRPVDFARWRRDHAQVRPAGSAWKEPGFAARSESIDPAIENPFENVFPLRSMGARESVISAGAAKSAQPQPASATTMVAQASPHAATATPEPAAGTAGVDVASRIEKFHAVVSRVANAVVRTADAGGGTAIVKLHPANLGRIQIEVTVEQQVAAVQLAVENPQVRQAMAQDGWMLRDSLAQQGLTLGEFSVRGDAAGAAPFGNRDAAASDRSTRGERSSREANVQTAPPPRRDLRATRVSMTI